MSEREQMIEVLVTGGAGFIGSNFVRHALAAHPDWRVTTLDKLTYAGRLENLHDVMEHPRHRFVKGDVADAAVAAPLVQAAEIVVHFAAETHVDRSILHAGDFITTDVFGTFVLLEAARESQKLRRFVQISTDEVYGSVPEGSSRETDELRPRNPYSASKAGADRLAYSYFATYGVPVIITRASNNYGPYQFPEKVIPLFVTNAIDDIPVPLYGDGLQVRDWLHVDDHCRAVDLLIDAGGRRRGLQRRRRQPRRERGPHAADPPACRQDDSLIRHVPDRQGHDRRYSLDTAKLRGAGLGAAGAFRRGPRRDRRSGTATTSGGGGRSRTPIPRSAPTTTRNTAPAVVTTTPRGLPLVTGATGFAGSHLVDRLLGHASRSGGLGESRGAAGRHVGSPHPVARRRPPRSREPSRRPSRTCSRARSSTSRGCRTSATPGRTPSGRCG